MQFFYNTWETLVNLWKLLVIASCIVALATGKVVDDMLNSKCLDIFC